MNEAGDNDGHIRNKLYRFRSEKSNTQYIVCVEQYKYNVFILKFYPKNWRFSKRKYNLLTNTHEPRRIIGTCINIALSVLDEYPDASFGFIGANRENEDTCETKRYKVYSTIVATYFSEECFYHKESKEKSAYLLINNIAIEQNPSLVKEIETFFNKRYIYLIEFKVLLLPH